MLKLSDLSLRPDFQLGPMLVSPPRRLVQGPGGSASVQPLIMQVFLMLVDARGQVVTRNDLFDQVWGGVMVGDDSLNRAIGKVRQIGAQVAPGLFEIETIPRTGYRLTGDILTSEHRILPDSEGRSQFGISRRAMLGSAAAVGVVAAGGLGLWSVRRSREDRRFDELMDLGKQAQLYGDGSNKAAEYFEQAAAMRPDNAKAQGLFALTQAMRRGRWWAAKPASPFKGRTARRVPLWRSILRSPTRALPWSGFSDRHWTSRPTKTDCERFSRWLRTT